ncbi:hypothetical protein M5K25_001637 [Dendrobium thyrsiflorum]|uniref:Uncharacterized protein n=1 Tax=Dendrobium thyrsiflorum TaxID=117978 RepID=A0ABD0VRE3_DENTH
MSSLSSRAVILVITIIFVTIVVSTQGVTAMRSMPENFDSEQKITHDKMSMIMMSWMERLSSGPSSHGGDH